MHIKFENTILQFSMPDFCVPDLRGYIMYLYYSQSGKLETTHCTDWSNYPNFKIQLCNIYRPNDSWGHNNETFWQKNTGKSLSTARKTRVNHMKCGHLAVQSHFFGSSGNVKKRRHFGRMPTVVFPARLEGRGSPCTVRLKLKSLNMSGWRWGGGCYKFISILQNYLIKFEKIWPPSSPRPLSQSEYTW